MSELERLWEAVNEEWAMDPKDRDLATVLRALCLAVLEEAHRGPFAEVLCDKACETHPCSYHRLRRKIEELGK